MTQQRRPARPAAKFPTSLGAASDADRPVIVLPHDHVADKARHPYEPAPAPGRAAAADKSWATRLTPERIRQVNMYVAAHGITVKELADLALAEYMARHPEGPPTERV